MHQPARGYSAAVGFLILFIGMFGCSSSHPVAEVPATAPAVVDLTGPNPYLGPGPRRLRIIDLIDEPDDWFRSQRGHKIVENILGWQNADGGWFKNYDPSKRRPAVIPIDPHAGPPGDDDLVWHAVSTFDNDATHSELRIVARAYRVLKDERCRESFERGLQYIFVSQYANGGWPQRFPLQDNYGRYITFNDQAMTDNMTLLKDIIDQKPDYTFVSEAERQHCQEAFDRGLDCVLKCQIAVNGKLTVWCQQHDEVTLEPRGGRTFELVGLSGQESDNIVMLLISINHPDERVKRAIEGAAAWYEASKIVGKRWVVLRGPQYFHGRDRALIDDPTAAPLWARYYDIQTNQPFVSGRDGHEKASVDQISWERRNGYGWYGRWGSEVLTAYAAWKVRPDVATTTQP